MVARRDGRGGGERGERDRKEGGRDVNLFDPDVVVRLTDAQSHVHVNFQQTLYQVYSCNTPQS